MDEKAAPREELEQASVNELAPNGGMRSSMTNADELLEKLKNKEPLTANEERLADLLTFHKTGKRLDNFKNPKPSKPTYTTPTISKDKGFAATREGSNTKPSAPAYLGNMITEKPVILSEGGTVDTESIS